ncbi:MAG TPA: hypothetical protein VGR26_01335 [Acidimicrobiales bacterium]|nr:hypothetical protein [Acidimicrobiales bacterium]
MREKPSLAEYGDWLETIWDGDVRELKPGRYLHQQAVLLRSFQASQFFERLLRSLHDWSDAYHQTTGYALFSGSHLPELQLHMKPWESFVTRTWRHNVLNNDSWPASPDGGWYLPDNWFEQLWDIVRTRLVVRYLDGVVWLAERIEQLAKEGDIGFRRVTHAQEWGYYAMHVVVDQPFVVQGLNYEVDFPRHTGVEIQLTTQLQEVITSLTHQFFEQRRETRPRPEERWQWDYSSREFTPYYLGHLLHYIEGMIMRMRTENQ